MTVIKREPSGIYYSDFRTASGSRIRQSLGTTDKREAKALEAKLMGQPEAEAASATIGLTLSDAFRHAMRVREEWRSAKSQHSIIQLYGLIAGHYGATCSLSSVTDDALMDYTEQLQDSGKSASTINKRLSLIAVLFDEAIKWKRYTGHKPRIVYLKVSNGRRRLITPQEEAQAISLCNPASPYELALADLIIVLADTGLRLSEALGIQPKNINNQSKAVLVVDTKSGDDRVVPLTDRALAVLQKRSNGYPLFQPADKHVLSHIWRRIRAKMGLQDDAEFVLHAFRHTYGSTLTNAGVDAFRIQAVMGHKVIATTQRYVHVSSAALGGLADIMQSRCDQKCDQK